MAFGIRRVGTPQTTAPSFNIVTSSSISPVLRLVLERYGLGSLAAWASDKLISGSSLEEIELELYDQPEFVHRFPAIRQREAAGLPPLSVDEYLAFENQAQQTALSFGFTLGKEEVDTLLSRNVSPAELEGRIGLAAAAVFEAPPEVRAELKRLYDVNDGELVRYWMDPKTEFARLQTRFASARISSAATASGFGQLAQQEAEYLTSAGVEPEQSEQGFAELTRMRELFTGLDRTEQDIGRQDQLGFLAFGQGAPELERRSRQRLATFSGGGEFATGRLGVAGLGSASTG